MKSFSLRLALIASLVCTSAAASNQRRSPASPPPASLPPAVTLGSPCYTFETVFHALILQSFVNNSDYAAEALPFNYGDAQPAVSPSWVIPVISPDFHFGFDIEVSGIFHEAQSNLKMNWERYHSSNDTGSLNVASANDMIGPFFQIGPDASFFKKGKGAIHFHFDEVNLDYGTFVYFGDRVQTNWFTGVGFARLLQHRSSRFANSAETIVRTLDIPAKFIGAGPQLGFDFDYKIVSGFRFVGAGRATLFVGNFKNSTTFKTSSPDLVTLGDQSPNVQTTTVYDKTGIVPGLETKLGFAYEYLFQKHYMFKIEAGYQAKIYINAVRSVDLSSEVAIPSAGPSLGSSTLGVYARTFQRTVSDFGMAGPYAGVDFAF